MILKYMVCLVISGFLVLTFVFSMSGCTEKRHEMKLWECEAVCEPRRFKNMKEQYIRTDPYDSDIQTYKCFCRSDDGDWIHYKRIGG